MPDGMTQILNSGPPGTEVNIAVLGDGFTEADQPTYNAKVQALLIDGVFGHDYYYEDAQGFNIYRVRAAAQHTRRAILDAATRLFVERGYVATTIGDVATAAGVAMDTIYAVVGRKPRLFQLLIETAISGTDAPVLADERDYVAAIQAETQAARKLDVYAQAMRTIHVRLAPLLRILQAAAPAEPELAALWSEITERRARNMRRFVADLAATGALREDLSHADAADVIWATNSPELYVLLVHERGWNPDHYARWLADAWRRLLLQDT